MLLNKLNKIQYYTLFFISLIITLLGCKSESNNLYYQDLKQTNFIDSFNDSIFFGRILDITVSKNQIFFSDQGNNQVIQTDVDYNFTRKYGISGPGPKEIKALSNIEIKDNLLAVQDMAGSKFLIYSIETGQLERVVEEYFHPTEFVLGEDFLIGLKIGEVQKPITKVYFDGKKTRFGEDLNSDWGYPNSHIIKSKNKFLSINRENIPLIEIYDLNGEFEKSIDLNNISLIKNWLNDLNVKSYISQSTASMKYSQTIFADVSTFEEKLYLTTPPLGEKNGIKHTYIFEVEFNDQMEPISIHSFKFEDAFLFRSFTVYRKNDKLTVIGYVPSKGGLIEYQ